MLLYLHDEFALHDTGQHPENAHRIERTNARLRAAGGLAEQVTCCADWKPASIGQCATAHDIGYLKALHERIAGMFAGSHLSVEADTVVSPHSWDVAMLAAGAAIDAVDRVLDAEDNVAMVVARPPGHHAVPDGPMGFCLVNNVALAAQQALARGVERILIVDFDVHHGNGTQDIFYQDPRVGFLSMHRYPFYPGTGSETETGTGDGLGAIRNLPITFGTSADQMIDRFRSAVDDFSARMRPELLLVSAGFDAHADDPIGSLGLQNEHFEWLTEILVQAAQAHSGGRIVSLLEGGYHLQRLPECVEIHGRRLSQ